MGRVLRITDKEKIKKLLSEIGLRSTRTNTDGENAFKPNDRIIPKKLTKETNPKLSYVNPRICKQADVTPYIIKVLPVRTLQYPDITPRYVVFKDDKLSFTLNRFEATAFTSEFDAGLIKEYLPKDFDIGLISPMPAPKETLQPASKPTPEPAKVPSSAAQSSEWKQAVPGLGTVMFSIQGDTMFASLLDTTGTVETNKDGSMISVYKPFDPKRKDEISNNAVKELMTLKQAKLNGGIKMSYINTKILKQAEMPDMSIPPDQAAAQQFSKGRPAVTQEYKQDLKKEIADLEEVRRILYSKYWVPEENVDLNMLKNNGLYWAQEYYDYATKLEQRSDISDAARAALKKSKDSLGALIEAINRHINTNYR